MEAVTEMSAKAELSWNTQHAIQWGDTIILDQGRRTKELKIKKALLIIITSLDQCLNWDEGLELMSCWTAMTVGGGGNSTPDPTSKTWVSSQNSAWH